MSRCTVCGGATQPAEQIDAQHGTERYEFCSDECKIVFNSEPAEYVAGVDVQP